jgi:hypothetical protein
MARHRLGVRAFWRGYIGGCLAANILLFLTKDALPKMMFPADLLYTLSVALVCAWLSERYCARLWTKKT